MQCNCAIQNSQLIFVDCLSNPLVPLQDGLVEGKRSVI